MFNIAKPSQGSLLLSEPFMSDPTFERSVILICEHDENGTLGLILNNRSHLILSDILDGVDSLDLPIYHGGPVATNSLFYIHRAYDKLQSGTHISEDIYWGDDFEKVLFLLEEKLINVDEVKFFIGYSGWSENQLDIEIQQNTWVAHPSFDSSLLFISDGENLWKQALISLGPKYAHVANFPRTPNLN